MGGKFFPAFCGGLLLHSLANTWKSGKGDFSLPLLPGCQPVAGCEILKVRLYNTGDPLGSVTKAARMFYQAWC